MKNGKKCAKKCLKYKFHNIICNIKNLLDVRMYTRHRKNIDVRLNFCIFDCLESKTYYMSLLSVYLI